MMWSRRRLRSLLLLFVMAGIGLFTAFSAAAFSTGGENANGRIGCASGAGGCHAIESSSRVLAELHDLPATYKPGASYRLTAQVGGVDSDGRQGFAVDVDGGTLGASGAETQMAPPQRTTVTHTIDGVGKTSWSFTWKAPADAGRPVRFWTTTLVGIKGATIQTDDLWNTDVHVVIGAAGKSPAGGVAAIACVVGCVLLRWRRTA